MIVHAQKVLTVQLDESSKLSLDLHFFLALFRKGVVNIDRAWAPWQIVEIPALHRKFEQLINEVDLYSTRYTVLFKFKVVWEACRVGLQHTNIHKLEIANSHFQHVVFHSKEYIYAYFINAADQEEFSLSEGTTFEIIPHIYLVDILRWVFTGNDAIMSRLLRLDAR